MYLKKINLKNKTALVTGAGKGIGRACSIALAEAGAARDHYFLLIFGLILSIVLMATVATVISKWIKKYKWIGWLGLLAILVVGIELIYSDLQLFI